MEFISFNKILALAVYRYLDEAEQRISNPTNHSTTNRKIVLNGISELEFLLLTNVELTNRDFGLIISNYPVLIDYLPKGLRNELVRGRSKS